MLVVLNLQFSVPKQTVFGGNAVTNKSELPYNNFSIDL